jgi:hypothetical protein
VPRWPGGHRAGPKSYSPGFEYRLGLFFIWTEAPQRTETHLRKKRLVCVPSPSLKAIIWPNSCATLNHLHCRPKTIGFPGVPISIENCASYTQILSRRFYFIFPKHSNDVNLFQQYQVTISAVTVSKQNPNAMAVELCKTF